MEAVLENGLQAGYHVWGTVDAGSSCYEIPAILLMNLMESVSYVPATAHGTVPSAEGYAPDQAQK